MKSTQRRTHDEALGNILIFLLKFVVVSPVVAQNRRELLPDGVGHECGVGAGGRLIPVPTVLTGTVMTADGFLTADRFVSSAGVTNWVVATFDLPKRGPDHWIRIPGM
jgi:hypothetical protein